LTGIHSDVPTIYEGNTWLEPEEWCYPRGGFTRRAMVRCPDGAYRVVVCSIADTYWTIPARLVYKSRHVSGHITLDEKSSPKEFIFIPGGKNRDVFGPPIVPPVSDCPEKVEALDRVQSALLESVRIPEEVVNAPLERVTASSVMEVPKDPSTACKLPSPKQCCPGTEYLDETGRTWKLINEEWVRIK
jgi:hypothetical protein